MNRSIKIKIIFGLLLPLIIMIGAIFTLTASNTKTEITERALSAAEDQLKGIEISLSLFLNEAMLNTHMLTLDPRAQKTEEILTNFLGPEKLHTPKAWSYDKLGQELQKLYRMSVNSHPAYIDVYLGTDRGAFICGSNDVLEPGYDPRERDWYKIAAREKEKVLISEAYLSTNGEAMVSTSKAVTQNGQVRGVIGVDITLTDITNLIKATRPGKEGFFLLFQDDGTILANPYDTRTNFKNIRSLQEKAYTAIFNNTKGVLNITLGGKNYQALSYTSPSLGWKLAGLVSQDELMGPIYTSLTNLGLIFLFSLLAISIFIWFFIDKSAVQPMKQIVAFLQKIRGGNYKETISHKRQDEIGQIFAALNGLTSTLEKNMQEITAKTDQAERKTKEAQEATTAAEAATQKAERAKSEGMRQAGNSLEEMAREIKKVTIDIAQETDEIYNGVEIQKDRIHSTATAMEEMNSTVLEVARNASNAATNAQQAREMANEGAQTVNSSVSSINAIQEEAASLRNNMNQLEEQAKAIGNIMSVITDIADQTNLLALNAAIEAARAGEAGRGFAVVADEVRKLAESTMSATREVGNTINAIQEVTQQNVIAMNKTVTDLEKATGLANSSGTVLQKIVQGSEMSADQIQSIATAAEEQSSASEEITQALEEINRIATDTETNVSQTKDQIASLNLLMENITELIEELKNA